MPHTWSHSRGESQGACPARGGLAAELDPRERGACCGRAALAAGPTAIGMSRAGSESGQVHTFRLFPKASGTEQRASTHPASRLARCLGREAACDFPEPEFENSAWPGASLIPSSPPLVLIPSGCGVTSPRFELPMGTTEQPPLPQQTQPPTKVPCPGPSGACPGTQSATHPAGDM